MHTHISIKKMRKIALVIGVLAFPWLINAQETDYNEKVVVMAPYQPTIGEVVKVTIPPIFVDTLVAVKKIRYDILTRPLNLSFTTENIKPAKITGEPLFKLSNQHIKLGFGNYKSPMADIYLSMGRNEHWAAGASYSHHSSWGTLEGYDTAMDNAYNELNVFGQYFSENFTVSARYFYSKQRVSCYGFSNDRTPPLSSDLLPSKRFYENLGGEILLQDNSVKEEDWHYSALFSFTHGVSYFRGLENIIGLGADASKELQSDFKYVESLILGGRIGYEYYSSLPWHNMPVQDNFKVKVEPTLFARYSILELNAALRFNIYKEEEATLQFNPVIDLKIEAVKNVFEVFTGIGGDVYKNTLINIAKENPFLSLRTTQNLPFSKTRFNFYAGFKSSIMKNLDWVMTLNTSTIDNFVYFDLQKYSYNVGSIIMYSAFNDFEVKTLDLNYTNIHGELSYIFSDRLSAVLSANYNYYNKEVLYKPMFDGVLDIRYDMGYDIVLKTKINAFSERLARNELGEMVNLKGAVDWGVGAEYTYDKNWSAFAQFNNLLNIRYYNWYDYPSFRFNFILGLAYSF